MRDNRLYLPIGGGIDCENDRLISKQQWFGTFEFTRYPPGGEFKLMFTICFDRPTRTFRRVWE